MIQALPVVPGCGPLYKSLAACKVLRTGCRDWLPAASLFENRKHLPEKCNCQRHGCLNFAFKTHQH